MKKHWLGALIMISTLTVCFVVPLEHLRKVPENPILEQVEAAVRRYIFCVHNDKYDDVLPYCAEERFARCIDYSKQKRENSLQYPLVEKCIDTYDIIDIRLKKERAYVTYAYECVYTGYNEEGENTMFASKCDDALIVLQCFDNAWIIVNYQEGA